MEFKVLGKTLYSEDLVSGLIVFLVALPLCLGIALASGAPLFSGIIAGIVGGIVVGTLSGSHLSVSGPAAGLTAIIVTQLEALNGNYQAFLVSVVLAGVIQIVFSVLKLGAFANYIPNSVIIGLLAGIGLMLIIGQIPLLFGLDRLNQLNAQMLDHPFDIGSAIIGIFSLIFILVWDSSKFKKLPIPSMLIVIILAGLLNFLFIQSNSSLIIFDENLINLPQILNSHEKLFFFPDFSFLNSSQIYIGAFTLAIIASLETILNLEAADRMDPYKRTSPPNRELFAQGIGNTFSGFIGGMPITSVIVRSSINATSGSKTKFSAITHGLLLIIAVLFLTPLLNYVPLSTLAAILLLTGYKLAKPELFINFYKKGWKQFLPFITTVIIIVTVDLLVGVIFGIAVSLAFILYHNLQSGIHTSYEINPNGNTTHIQLLSHVSFLNRAMLSKALSKVKDNEYVIVDASQINEIDPDLYIVIEDFKKDKAKLKNITIQIIGCKKNSFEMV
ncbi:SulP family inorganic anion transporter [Acinetobacter pollinis]|uniref:SulP family inorganic anion transporter n=1 Tax=Acinetobacter pollinis TaxID=2605270 RepID=A0ABU6DSY2_9GAMM|nr:solute carrier family 23 protein [Acinetobacter pollinis]MEB5476013.1 SulP family inorganic anion transporter [Acinetobacter pollinis]